MEQSSNEGKRGTIQSFFSLQSAKKQKSDNSLISTEVIVSQSDTVGSSFTTNEQQQQEKTSLSSSSSSSDFLLLLSPSSNRQHQAQNSLSSADFSPLLASSSSKQQREQHSLSSSFNEQQQEQHFLSSTLNDQQQAKVSLSSSSEYFPLLSPASSKQQQEKIPSASLDSPSLMCSSSNRASRNNPSSNDSLSNISDISRSMNELPSQPHLAAYPLNKNKRCFRSQWFSQFRWLEYSIEKDSAYCYYCRHFSIGTNINSRNQSDGFLRGFNSWKRAFCANQGFLHHQNSKSHKQAEINYEEYILRTKSAASVLQVLDKSRNDFIRNNREKLTKIVSTLHLCGKQMIALRGHLESELSSNQGNFIELLRWASHTDPIALSILNDSAKNATYLSPIIQNELISLLAEQIRQQISEKIKGCRFALMADESRDISGHEQLSVVVRVIDSEMRTSNNSNQQPSLFNEYFLGFIKLDEFDAETLANEIVKLLSSLSIDLNDCIAMCFDGASVMSGKNAGVQALLRQQHIPNAIYVHCYAHKLNLVICDVTKNVPYLSEFYSIISKIYTYFHTSSVTNEIFKKTQEQLKIVLIESLKELIDEGTERSIDARGLLLALKEPLFIVTIFILHCLLGKIKILSDQLKSKSLDFGKAHTLTNAVINQISGLRNEEEFSTLFGEINKFCVENGINLNDQIKHRRARTISTRFKNCLVTSTIGQREEIDNEIKYKNCIFYPVIDSILVEMKDRFSQTNMEILRGISSLSPDNPEFLEVQELKDLCILLKCDIRLLSNEIQVLKPMLKESKSNDIISLYFELLPLRQAFPTVISLLIGAMTIPVSSTTTERTFSKMKLIKTSARNSMSDSRLSDLSILAIEKDFAIDYEKIIDAFAIRHKNCRIMLK